MNDADRLARYVAAWKESADSVVALLRSIDAADWDAPTDLPGWSVRAVAAHLAHLESELAGHPQASVEVPDLEHLTALSSSWTETGVIARSGDSTEALIDELEQAVASRHAALVANPPTDASAAPPITPGGMPWDWETMLSNRVVDVWMHNQDIRRAVDRPGDLDGLGARHTAAVFARAIPYVVGKKVAPPAGTTVRVDIAGVDSLNLVIDEGGRAQRLADVPTDPTVALDLDLESLIILAGGRRPADRVPATIHGDADLARRILEAMTVTF